jgi:hypothetical protein
LFLLAERRVFFIALIRFCTRGFSLTLDFDFADSRLTERVETVAAKDEITKTNVIAATTAIFRSAER